MARCKFARSIALSTPLDKWIGVGRPPVSLLTIEGRQVLGCDQLGRRISPGKVANEDRDKRAFRDALAELLAYLSAAVLALRYFRCSPQNFRPRLFGI